MPTIEEKPGGGYAIRYGLGAVKNVGEGPVNEFLRVREQGRAFATLDDLDENTLMEILTRPKNALIKQYGRLFEMEGVKLSFTEDALASVAKRAIARKTGATSPASAA